MLVKQKASRSFVPRAPVNQPTPAKMCTLHGAKSLYDKLYNQIKVAHDRYIKCSSGIVGLFSLLICLESFLFISKDLYKLAGLLFYSSFYCPAVHEGEETIHWSFFFNVPIEFSLSSICDMPNLLIEGECIFLNANEKFALL